MYRARGGGDRRALERLRAHKKTRGRRPGRGGFERAKRRALGWAGRQARRTQSNRTEAQFVPNGGASRQKKKPRGKGINRGLEWRPRAGGQKRRARNELCRLIVTRERRAGTARVRPRPPGEIMPAASRWPLAAFLAASVQRGPAAHRLLHRVQGRARRRDSAPPSRRAKTRPVGNGKTTGVDVRVPKSG